MNKSKGTEITEAKITKDAKKILRLVKVEKRTVGLETPVLLEMDRIVKALDQCMTEIKKGETTFQIEKEWINEKHQILLHYLGA